MQGHQAPSTAGSPWGSSDGKKVLAGCVSRPTRPKNLNGRLMVGQRHVSVENLCAPSLGKLEDFLVLRCSCLGYMGGREREVPVWSQGVDLIQLRPGPSVEAPNAAGSPPTCLSQHMWSYRPGSGRATGVQQMSPSPCGTSCLSFLNCRF